MELKATEKEFRKYLKMRNSGKFNMATEGFSHSGMTEDAYYDILQNFKSYVEKYGE